MLYIPDNSYYGGTERSSDKADELTYNWQAHR